MAVTVASFHLLGSVESSSDFLNIVVRSLDCICLVSFNSIGCIWSGPCDFPFFNSLSTFRTFSSVMSTVSSGSLKLRS